MNAPPLPALLAGSWGFPVCWLLATLACSLALIKQAYVFSLSYGVAMAAIGASILASSASVSASSFALTSHAALVTAYGVRLFGFLLWREVGQDSGWGRRLAALDKTPRSKRVPIILSTGLFYALMASPLLFHFQTSMTQAMPLPTVSRIGNVVAAIGLAIEALADQSKSLFKISLRNSGQADRNYVGGPFRFSRHANYLGEIIFWVGATLAGLPAIVAPGTALATRALRLLSMALGCYGIVFIMLSATARLEKKQAAAAASKWPVLRADGELDSYDDYVARSGKLLPKFW